MIKISSLYRMKVLFPAFVLTRPRAFQNLPEQFTETEKVAFLAVSYKKGVFYSMAFFLLKNRLKKRQITVNSNKNRSTEELYVSLTAHIMQVLISVYFGPNLFQSLYLLPTSKYPTCSVRQKFKCSYGTQIWTCDNLTWE